MERSALWRWAANLTYAVAIIVHDLILQIEPEHSQADIFLEGMQGSIDYWIA